MRKHLISAMTIAALSCATATTVLGNYKGPHPVMQYHGNEYAVVINPGNGGKSLVVYRAVGSLWERVGGTIVSPGQSTSNGGLPQDVWFKGRKIRTVRGDLRRPFYRLYRSQIDY